jgi:hypothetical protein
MSCIQFIVGDLLQAGSVARLGKSTALKLARTQQNGSAVSRAVGGDCQTGTLKKELSTSKEAEFSALQGQGSEECRRSPLLGEEHPGKLSSFVRADRPELIADRAVRLDWLITDKKFNHGAKAVILLGVHNLTVRTR